VFGYISLNCSLRPSGPVEIFSQEQIFRQSRPLSPAMIDMVLVAPMSPVRWQEATAETRKTML